MTSPLIRAWFAARLVDWADHGYAIWRDTLAAFGISTEWDPCEIEARYLLDVSAPVSAVAAGTKPGTAVSLGGLPSSPAFHTLMPCPVCHVSVGKDCITRFGNVTGPHRARRDAAARQTAAETAS